MSTVAVVVPSYNYARFLRETMESVIAQTFTDWTLAVVDDGSTDESVTVARTVASEHPDRHILVAERTHVGSPAVTRNIARELTDSRWLLHLDSDDLLARDALEKMVALDQPWVYPDYMMFRDHDGKRISTPYAFDDDAQERILETNTIPCGSLIERRIVDEIGGWMPQYQLTCDWMLWVRTTRAGHRATHLPEPLYWYRIGHASMMHPRGR